MLSLFFQLFAPLLKQNPKALQKLIAIEGDITEEDLGLKPEVKQKLQQNVNIIFHVAASLKLEAGLKEAVDFNLKGTKRMLELALGIKNLEVSDYHYCFVVIFDSL